MVAIYLNFGLPLGRTPSGHLLPPCPARTAKDTNKRSRYVCTQKLNRMATYEDEQFKEKTKQLIQQETKDTVSYNDEQFKEQTRRLIREESYELKQREARECNIIISNMSEEERESDEEDGSSDTDTVVQRATDHEKVTEMIHKILKLENVEITEVKRLSKPDDDERPRLVWVNWAAEYKGTRL